MTQYQGNTLYYVFVVYKTADFIGTVSNSVILRRTLFIVIESKAIPRNTMTFFVFSYLFKTFISVI
jgi:hypothetical protein